MYADLLPIFAQEAQTLAERYGAPLVRHVAVCPDVYWTSQTSNRDAEVCMVIRRDDSRILAFTKRFYPAGLYRLFTGGIEYGETILNALLRETHEETGLAVTVHRFLAVVTYSPDDVQSESGAPPRYTTFVFLLDAPTGMPVVSDPEEPITGYREIEVADISAIAERLESLPDVYSSELDCSWRDWGRFRAAIHRAVAEALVSVVVDNGTSEILE